MVTWEDVKQILKVLWLEENWELERIVREMRDNRGFHQVARDYKAQFAKWGWSKNVRKKDMEKALQHYAGRTVSGRSTSILINQRPINKKNARRQASNQMQAIARSLALKCFRDQIKTVDGQVLPFSNSFFLKWNLPYAAIRHAYIRSVDHSSPLEQPSPCDHIEVTTPSSAVSPNGAPSPTTKVMNKLMMVERARMFAHGEHDKLLKSLDGDERRTLSDWLYQYWFFCFKTAKHWGKGPVVWTAEQLNFEKVSHAVQSSLPGTLQDLTHSLTPHNNDDSIPSNLCRWYIHVRHKHYIGLEEDDAWDSARQGLDEDPTWTTWSQNEQKSSLQTRLRDALEHNDFSPTPVADLPVAIPQIAQAAHEARSNELLVESLGFSIISRNLDQINRILKQLYKEDISPAPLHPFHLATSYLNGSASCCDVFELLAHKVNGAQVYETYRDEHGHTILDNLMITIIKSHTTARPVIVNGTLRDVARFVGEEVDICGRWDADSPCVRQLHSIGKPSVPSSWKHKFCNTSIQTICHCITLMSLLMPSPLVHKEASGLYVRQCTKADCGTKLQLQPLHSLVVTAYHLASKGKDDEDLFGILACALCLISNGFDPCTRVEVSVTALLSDDTVADCDHKDLTAAELAFEFSTLPLVNSWSAKLQTGWIVLTNTLQRCQIAHAEQNHIEQERNRRSGNGNNAHFVDAHYMGSTEPDGLLRELHESNWSAQPHLPLSFVRRPDLGALWSSIVAELLSYRRVSEELRWISDRFSMEDLADQLEHGEDLAVGYVRDNLLKAHCACHSFGGDPYEVLDEVIDPNLANLDVWDRATYGERVE